MENEETDIQPTNGNAKSYPFVGTVRVRDEDSNNLAQTIDRDSRLKLIDAKASNGMISATIASSDLGRLWGLSIGNRGCEGY